MGFALRGTATVQDGNQRRPRSIADLPRPWTMERIREAALEDAAERIRDAPHTADEEVLKFIEIGALNPISAMRWLASLNLPQGD